MSGLSMEATESVTWVQWEDLGMTVKKVEPQMPMPGDIIRCKCKGARGKGAQIETT
jgi:hypothetical protein